MEQQVAQLHAQITALMGTIQIQQEEFSRRLASIEQRNITQTTAIVDHEDIKLNVQDPREIDLELFKSLPKFDGNQSAYRSWRSQVWTFMEAIKNHSHHPKYYSALGIVRTKITGPAADILTNHNTKMNFYSIINRLDFTFADQRPLYVLLDEMKKITQGRRTLAEFHSEVSKALNLVLSKMEMSSEQNNMAMKDYANQEAVRTFILGLNSKYTSGTLYSNNPNNLESAYAIACTIYHDNPNQQFEMQTTPSRFNQNHRYNPRFNQNQPTQPHLHREDRHHHQYRPNVRMQRNDQQSRNLNNQQPAPVPMDIDSSRQFVSTTRNNKTVSDNYNNNIFKRNREYSNQNVSMPQNQRINQTIKEDLESVDFSKYEEHFESGSTFLGE